MNFGSLVGLFFFSGAALQYYLSSMLKSKCMLSLFLGSADCTGNPFLVFDALPCKINLQEPFYVRGTKQVANDDSGVSASEGSMLIWSSSTEMVVRWFCIERQGTNTSCNISDLLLSFDAENVANLTSGRCIHDIDGSSLGCKDQGTSNCKDYRIQNLSAMWTQPHGYSNEAVGIESVTNPSLNAAILIRELTGVSNASTETGPEEEEVVDPLSIGPGRFFSSVLLNIAMGTTFLILLSISIYGKFCMNEENNGREEGET